MRNKVIPTAGASAGIDPAAALAVAPAGSDAGARALPDKLGIERQLKR